MIAVESKEERCRTSPTGQGHEPDQEQSEEQNEAAESDVFGDPGRGVSVKEALPGYQRHRRGSDPKGRYVSAIHDVIVRQTSSGAVCSGS
jgi:hypothetical protein